MFALSEIYGNIEELLHTNSGEKFLLKPPFFEFILVVCWMWEMFMHPDDLADLSIGGGCVLVGHRFRFYR